MFLARKARMQQYTSVAYGQNDEHPDLEFQDSSADSSSEDENSVPRHAVRIEAYDDLDNVRSVSFWNYYESKVKESFSCSRASVGNGTASQSLLDSGKGLELFQKRQERMGQFTVHQANSNYSRERHTECFIKTIW